VGEIDAAPRAWIPRVAPAMRRNEEHGTAPAPCQGSVRDRRCARTSHVGPPFMSAIERALSPGALPRRLYAQAMRAAERVAALAT